MTRPQWLLIVACAALCLTLCALAEDPAPTSQPTTAPTTKPAGDGETPTDPLGRPGLMERKRLTDGWLEFLQQASEKGVDVTLGLTNVYQENLHGGESTHRQAGRYSGAYDLEIGVDLEKLKLIPGGKVYALAQGSWSQGIDGPSVGSLFGVNCDAYGDRATDLLQLWYEQSLLENRLKIRVGKLDMTGGFQCQGCPVSFDGNTYANDPTLQFLNCALINNPSIPFPQQGLGAIVFAEPVDGFYMSAGIADANADNRTTGWHTAFEEDANTLTIFETGITPTLPSANGPMQGAYRVGAWYDTALPKADSWGGYTSCDQMIFKEDDNKDDTQGLGLFARYGLANDDVFMISQFWSAGAQYQGLIPGRDNDVLGFGVANGQLRTVDFDYVNGGFVFPKGKETVYELYYNIMLAPWLSLTPDFQFIKDPISTGSDASVFGLRLQITF